MVSDNHNVMYYLMLELWILMLHCITLVIHCMFSDLLNLFIYFPILYNFKKKIMYNIEQKAKIYTGLSTLYSQFFTPICASVDGLLGKESNFCIHHLCDFLNQMCTWFLEIAFVQKIVVCMCVSCVSAHWTLIIIILVKSTFIDWLAKPVLQLFHFFII